MFANTPSCIGSLKFGACIHQCEMCSQNYFLNSHSSPYKFHKFIDHRSHCNSLLTFDRPSYALHRYALISLTQCLDKRALAAVDVVAAGVIELAYYGQPTAPPSQMRARYDSGEDLADSSEIFTQGEIAGFGGAGGDVGIEAEVLLVSSGSLDERRMFKMDKSFAGSGAQSPECSRLL